MTGQNGTNRPENDRTEKGRAWQVSSHSAACMKRNVESHIIKLDGLTNRELVGKFQTSGIFLGKLEILRDNGSQTVLHSPR